MTDKPHQHFGGLVAGLRADVKHAVDRARGLKTRGAQSLSGFSNAADALHAVYDEVDAATAEINGTLQGPGDNGGPALDDVKNSDDGSAPTPAAPSNAAGASNQPVTPLRHGIGSMTTLTTRG